MSSQAGKGELDGPSRNWNLLISSKIWVFQVFQVFQVLCSCLIPDIPCIPLLQDFPAPRDLGSNSLHQTTLQYNAVHFVLPWLHTRALHYILHLTKLYFTLHFTLHSTLHYTLNSTQHYTIHYTLHQTLHYTIHYTLQKLYTKRCTTLYTTQCYSTR